MSDRRSDVFLEVVLVIGHHADLPAGLEDAQHLGHPLLADESAFLLSFFRPGVGEVDVQDVDRLRPDALAHEPARFLPADAHVLQLRAAHAVGGEAGEPVGVLDPDEVRLRARPGLVEQERPLADPDLQLDR
ncbi:MAG TPA: hypothetical protein PKB10_03535, partial [Tepidisphaeraceae bacterium]|nr:hypothetical protein [Tepidisphaeraceae bacterium]